MTSQPLVKRVFQRGLLVVGPLAALIALATFAAHIGSVRASGAVDSGSSLFLPESFLTSGGTAAMSVALADLNGDGKADVVVANQCGGNTCNQGGGHGEGTFGVLLGSSHGRFRPKRVYDSGGCNAWSVAVGDFNRDGKPDVAVLNHLSGAGCTGSSVVGIFLGNGDGTFQTLPGVPCVGNSSYVVTIADVNGDGNPDLIVGTSFGGVGILLGNGDGTFQPWTTYKGIGLSFAMSIVVADLNHDGKVDLVISNNGSAPNLSVLFGNGDGTFRTATGYDSGGYGSYAVALGDVNGDGKPDLVAGNFCANPQCTGDSVVGVLVGNGDGTFQAPVVFDAGGTLTTSLALADVNADGKLDILVPSYSGATAGTTALFLGNGDGSFQSPSILNFNAYWLTVADVSGDGRPDLVAGTGSGSVGVALHIGGPTTTAVTTSGSPSHVGDAVTFTATVISKYGTVPDGDLVTFWDGKKVLGSVLLSTGTATFTTSSLSAKSHTVKAFFAGDSNFDPSHAAVIQVVEP